MIKNTATHAEFIIHREEDAFVSEVNRITLFPGCF